MLPVVLIAGWLNLASGAGAKVLLQSNAVRVIVTLIAVGICLLLGLSGFRPRIAVRGRLFAGMTDGGRWSCYLRHSQNELVLDAILLGSIDRIAAD